MASSTAQIVYGAWRNYATNTWVLALSEREAGVLSAALVIIVGTTVAQAWNVLKFILHQIRGTSILRDGLHQQQQLALKNSATHQHMALLATKLLLRWRHSLGLRTALLRSAALMALPLVSFVGWSIAALFISLVWTTLGNEALLVPTYYGLGSTGESDVAASEFYNATDIYKGGGGTPPSEMRWSILSMLRIQLQVLAQVRDAALAAATI
ncbi:hypothetical protein N0V88_003156 [Collariella sp. IMI 366227]|nr:hypothetical protein N0V88_003156 [Collariella sp. IMI 366227]